VCENFKRQQICNRRSRKSPCARLPHGAGISLSSAPRFSLPPYFLTSLLRAPEFSLIPSHQSPNASHQSPASHHFHPFDPPLAKCYKSPFCARPSLGQQGCCPGAFDGIFAAQTLQARVPVHDWEYLEKTGESLSHRRFYTAGHFPAMSEAPLEQVSWNILRGPQVAHRSNLRWRKVNANLAPECLVLDL